MKNPKFSARIFVLILLGLATFVALAAPYNGEESFTYRQPDGETFQVHLFGDEFFAYQETIDGYLVIRDPNSGIFCYAKVTPDGSEIISTGVRVGQAKPAGLTQKQRLAKNMAMQKSLGNRNLLGVDEKGRRNHGKKLIKGKNGNILNVAEADAPVRPEGGDEPAPDGSSTEPPPVAPAPPVAPTVNKRVGLVLLASFPDRPGDVTKTVANVDDYCNAETYTADGNATSVYGYFKIQSNGKLSYKNNVTAWFTAANPRSYYTDPTAPYASRARDLIKEGLAVLKAQGFDFTQCDGNNDGKLDGVNIFYAGARTNEWSEGIWPHQSSSSWTGLTGTGLSSTSYDYQITDMPASLPIGTFCHENGHMICDFPDLYSYDGNAANLGNYSLMASSGSTHPRNVDPYLKIHAGWADVVDLTSSSHQLCAVQQDRNFFYRYRNPAKTTEYFLFEVRGTAGYEGVWNGAGATNPANGLVIYHALQTGSNPNSTIFTADAVTNYTKPYELMVVESTPSAAAPWYDDPTPGTNDAFSSTGVNAISDNTSPVNLRFWAADGRTTASGADVHTISAAGATMSFVIGTGSLPATPATNVTATQFQPNVDYGENVANHSFSVFNGGGGTLSYTISDDVAWLSCAPSSGTATTEADLIAVSFTTTALAAGTHNGTITIDGGSAGIKTIAVTLTVNQRPTLAASPGSLSLAGVSGTTGPSDSFNISNTGGGTVAYTITKTQAWLSLDRTSGTVSGEQDLVTVTLNATSLAPGVYNDTITVSSAEATNSPLTIPISFTVDGTDMILTAPNGGENWYLGTSQAITWASTLGGTVKIELFKNGVLHTTIATGAPNTGSYSWTLPGTLAVASDYKIKVTSVEDPTKTDQSFNQFTIAEDLLALALDTTGFTWSTGTAAWFRTTTAANTYDGVDAAESANISHGESTTMETTIVGPGTMTFWWKVSSESGYDFLRFYLNDVEQTGSLAKISGTVAWVQKTVSIPSGTNVVKWVYDKDGSVDTGSDTAWVDQVVYTPTAQPEIAVEQPVGTGLVDGTASINFGSINTGSSSSQFTFTVKNVGSADLSGISITKSGTNNTDFTVSGLTPGSTTIAAGNSATFTVTFAPGAVGARTAALQIASNDSDENPFDINLTGTGVGPGSLAVTPAGNFATSGNFSGPFTATQIYTLTNPGNTSINWTVAKTQSWVTLSSTSGTLAAGASTPVTVSINSAANVLNVGGYSDTVTFTNSTNGVGNTTRGVALTVNAASASVTLGNLAQTYNGSPKNVSVTTNPVGLAHSITYNGSGTAPTNAGTYAVVATITNSNYTGSASNNLVIAKGSQTITFNALSAVLDNATPFSLVASASSGLAVTYSSSNTDVATVSGNTVTIVGIGSTTITASQAGNANYDSAASVGQSLTVYRSNPLASPGGPYKVIVGQSLSLNGSTSIASYGNTITNYEWDLNNDNNFTDATGATPTSITSATLISTWGMTASGSNTIKLRVTDSAAKTSTITTTVELINALTWDANATVSSQTNGGGAWLNTNQWWDGTANLTWTPGANVSFGGPNTAGGAVTLSGPTSAGSITFNTFTGTYTLGTAGQMLTINGGINKTATSAAVIFSSPLTLGANQTWTNNSSGALTVNDTLNNGGFDLIIDGSGQINFGTTSSIVSGSGGVTVNSGLTKFGSGVAPVHTYSGSTNLNGGVTMFANNFSANSNININGGILETYWTTPVILGLGTGANQIRITGGESGFSMNGNNGLTINLGNAAATITWGGVNFAPSKFVLQSAYSQGSSAITFANGLNLNGANRTILVNAGATGGARATISGAISNSTGTAGLIKEGAAILSLSNNSSAWNGTTTISGGLLDLGGISLANIGGGSGRNITIASGAGVRFSTLSNAILNRLVETTAEITVMTGGTSNNLDFSSATGANLPNAFLGNWASNGAKAEYTGTLTPAADHYRLGGKFSGGLLGIVGTNKLTGSRGLLVGTTTGGGRVELAGANDFSGNTVIRSGARLTLSNNLALQNSALDLGAAGGTFSLSDGLNSGRIAGGVAAPSPTFGGLIGSRNLLAAFSAASGGNNESVLAASAVTGFTLNPGMGVVCDYSGGIADFATGMTITKTGLGTQIFSGNHTYTGTTTVSAGKLFINGSLSNVAAALNVASGAVLGGSGTIGRDITIADGGKLEFNIGTNAAGHDALDISTGRSFTFSGASELTITSTGGASVGVYTLISGGNNLIGSVPSVVNLPVGWLATVSKSGNSLILILTSTTSEPVDHFVISEIASPQTAGTSITGITLTAKSASNQTAVGFTGTVTFGGTAGITGTSANFVGGVLSGLNLTPTVSGNSLTFTVNDGAGHTGLATFNVQSAAYSGWINTGASQFENTFTDTALTSNPDGDSLNNLQEFAFGMDPTTPTTSALSFDVGGEVTEPGVPLLRFAASQYSAVFARRKDHASAGLTYTAEFSADLKVWESYDASTGTVLTGAGPGALEAVSLEFPATVPVYGGGAEQAPKFFRVGVEEN